MALLKAILITIAVVPSASAQAHSYSKAEIEDGMHLYRTSCIGCHGSEGASISGIDLGHGKFRHVSTDEEIVSVIVSGVPGTGMPASKISRPRAFTIVAYIRTMSDAPERKSIAAKSGSAVRGKALFENQAGCSSCHRIRGQGGRSEAATGEKKWQLDFVDVTDAGILTTASDLLFTGNREEHFFALDARTGTVLWKTSLGGSISNGPISYAVDGQQFIAIAAGNALYVFGLR